MCSRFVVVHVSNLYNRAFAVVRHVVVPVGFSGEIAAAGQQPPVS